MAKITNEHEVLDWARQVCEANGEKFTALSKSEQLLIARYIVKAEKRQCSGTLPSQEDDKPAQTLSSDAVIAGELPPVKAETPANTEKAKNAEIAHSAKDKAENEKLDDETRAKPLTRSEHYHRLRMKPQQVYDAFLAYTDKHPLEYSVMDFRSGVKSANAAFAYWLGGAVDSELTPAIESTDFDSPCLENRERL